MGIVYLPPRASVSIKGGNNTYKEIRRELGPQNASTTNTHLLSSGKQGTFLKYCFWGEEVVRLYEVPGESDPKCWGFQPQYSEHGPEIMESRYLNRFCVVRQRLFLYTEPSCYMTIGHVLSI